MMKMETMVQLAKSARSRFEGVYPDYDSAVAAVPANLLSGYDHEELSRIYLPAIGKVRPSDYPVLYWMSKIMPEIDSVFDWGGNIGVSYFTFARYVDYPSHLQWTICDVPAVCRAGEAVAAEKGAPLRFTSDFGSAEGAGLLLCIGALQYIPASLSDRLSSLKAKPAHVIVNRVPVWDGEAFVTLEQIGRSRCAYQIFNRKRMIENMLKSGYQLVDQWQTADLSCHVRWQPKYSIAWQSGLYFKRVD